MIPLQIHVECAVRPLRADDRTKLRMRKELYSHLHDIYQQEFQQCGDEMEAVELAKQRFGQPECLTAQLQTSVSKIERFHSGLEQHMRQRADETELRHAWRVARWYMVFCPLCFFGSAALVFLLSWAGLLKDFSHTRLDSLIAMYFAVGFCLIVGSFVFTSIGHRMRRQFERSLFRPRSIVGVVSLVVISVLSVLVGGWSINLVVTWDIVMSLELLWFSWLVLAGLGSIGAVAVGVTQAFERRRREPWTSLRIDE